jgi:hypothetical protein
VDRPSGENGAFSQAIKPNWRRRVQREGADLLSRLHLLEEPLLPAYTDLQRARVPGAVYVGC